MTKKKQTALDALDAFEREQQERDRKQAELRRAAALELGFAVLDAGGARLGADALREAVRAMVAASPAATDAGQGQAVRRA